MRGLAVCATKKHRTSENGDRYKYPLCTVVKSRGTIPQQLGNAKNHGALLISPVVYAELLAYPRATETYVDGFLSDTGITVDFQMEWAVWVDAGRRYARYADQRRKAGHGEPKRLLADFLIGSHALLRADRLMSLIRLDISGISRN